MSETLNTDFVIDVTVVTMADGLEHNYFSYITWLKDNASPVGTGTLVTAYMPNVLNYWLTYSDVVVISAKLDNNNNNTNTPEYYSENINKYYQEQNKKREINEKVYNRHHTDTPLTNIPKQRLINYDYNYSFICKVDKAKQRGTEILITLKDIGWKFIQYVPEKFRKEYIANQYVDDAFQSICELLGVEFAYSIDTLHQYKFAADGYSITKDNVTIENVPNTIANIMESDTIKAVSDPNYTLENNDLNEYNKKQQTVNNNQNQQDPISIASASINTITQQISTNQNNENNPNIDTKKELYEEDFHEKIRDLFIGNSYYDSDLITNVMNYDAITTNTISSDTSNMQTVNDDATYNAKTISQQAGIPTINASDKQILQAGKQVLLNK